jgi:hypothetical protein
LAAIEKSLTLLKLHTFLTRSGKIQAKVLILLAIPNLGQSGFCQTGFEDTPLAPSSHFDLAQSAPVT